MNLKTPIIIVDRHVSRVLEDTNYPSGGSAIQLLSWIDGLLSIGVPVYIVCDDIPQTISDRFKKVQFIPLENRLKRSDTQFKSLQYFSRLFRVLRKERAIVYQTGAGTLTFVTALICKYCNHTFIHRIANDADVDMRIYKKLPFTKALLYKIGKSLSDLLICQNEYQYGFERKHRNRSELVILHNPYVDLFNGKVNYSPAGRSYFAWVGIFQHQKNLPLLFDLAHKLKDEIIHIAGIESGNIDARTSNAVRKLKKLPNVTFRGFLGREEMNAFYSGAIALINTSHYEGFSNTFLEAWSMGTPVITSEDVNPGHIISDHHLGIVVNSLPGYIDAVKSIKKMDTYTLLSSNCKEYVDTFHNPEKLAKELVQAIHASAKG